jgi:hypothetical protein
MKPGLLHAVATAALVAWYAGLLVGLMMIAHRLVMPTIEGTGAQTAYGIYAISVWLAATLATDLIAQPLLRKLEDV